MDKLLHYYEHFGFTVSQAFFPFGSLQALWPVMGLVPFVLMAMAVGAFDASLQPEKTSRTIRGVLISQPLTWVAACALFIPFWNEAEADQEKICTVIGWLNWSLIALLVLPGIGAVAFSHGWNRFITGLFLCVNLWFLLICCFFGLMAVSGTWL